MIDFQVDMARSATEAWAAPFLPVQC